MSTEITLPYVGQAISVIDGALPTDYLKQRVLKTNRKFPRVYSIEEPSQASSNNPFPDIPRIQFVDDASAREQFLVFLNTIEPAIFDQHFALLVDLGLSIQSAEDEVHDTCKSKSDLKPAVRLYLENAKSAWFSIQKLFGFMKWLIVKNRLVETHIQAFTSIIEAFDSLDLARQVRFLKPIETQLAHNQDRCIFEVPMVYPHSSLSELLLAMPVWYLSTTTPSTDKNDPQPSRYLKKICDAGGGQNFAWLYQIYNRRDRSLEQFPSIDPVPQDLSELMSSDFTNHFEVVAYATPYHNLASTEWADPTWQSGLDPLALGFFSDIPFVIGIKRWSGNGILPSFANLTADTINHLQTHKNLLNKFSAPFWYKSQIRSGIFHGCLSNDQGQLEKFAEEIVSRFNGGKVYDFLHG